MDIYFGDWLLQKLKEKDWSQAKLARKAGVTRQAINAYINQRRATPELEVLIAIADAFGISRDEVFRAAGILAPSPDDAGFEEWKHMLSQLPQSDRDELLEIARLKLERQRRQKAIQDNAHAT